jgi:excisionase family DNA binding protein
VTSVVGLLAAELLVAVRDFPKVGRRMQQGCARPSSMANRYPQATIRSGGYPQIRVDPDRAGTFWNDGRVEPRFLTLADVAETLNVSASQAYALVRSGVLPAIKVGGRGQWRVEITVLEDYIQRMYEQTRSFIDAHPQDPAEVPEII